MKIVSFPKRTFDWLRINSSKSSSDLYCDSTNRLLPCKMVIPPFLLSGRPLPDESFYSRSVFAALPPSPLASVFIGFRRDKSARQAGILDCGGKRSATPLLHPNFDTDGTDFRRFNPC